MSSAARRAVGLRSLTAVMAAVALTAGCENHERARQNYLLHCMGCHGENGEGLEGQVPDMRTDLAQLLASPGGRAYVLRVPGVTQSTLEPELVAEVLNYTVREFGGRAAAGSVAPFTGDEVAEARTKPLLEITATRASVVDGGGPPAETAPER